MSDKITTDEALDTVIDAVRHGPLGGTPTRDDIHAWIIRAIGSRVSDGELAALPPYERGRFIAVIEHAVDALIFLINAADDTARRGKEASQ